MGNDRLVPQGGGSLSGLDWFVFVAFVVWVVYDGIRRSSGTSDLEGYFAGGRSVPWWAAGLSVMATQASAITVIGTTGQGHESGMEFVQLYFGLPFALVLICLYLVPLFRSAPLLTAYEYLERRFGPETRAVASAVFLLGRCLAFGVVLYAPAVMLSEMIGVSVTWTVLTIGVLTTSYTSFGGVRAVIYTDVKQMLVILGGLAVCFGIVLWNVLGEMTLWEGMTLAGRAGRLEAVDAVPASLDLVPVRQGAPESAGKSFWDDKYNLWSGLLGGLFLHLAYFGCDQSQVQRILTNPTANDSRKALLLSAFLKVPMQAGVLLLGVFIWLYHVQSDAQLYYSTAHQTQMIAAAQDDESVHVELVDLRNRHRLAVDARQSATRQVLLTPDGPQRAGALREFDRTVVRERALRDEGFELLRRVQGVASTPGDTNRIFPHFILHHLPPVLLGLVIAAIFAAAMSSADSALNSLSSATIVDFYKPWINPKASETDLLLASRIVTWLWGMSATFFALQVSGSSSIVELVNSVGSYFYGTLLGAFALAVLVPRAGRWASFVALLSGMAAVLVVDQTLRMQYLWYNVIGAAAVLVVGASLSVVWPRRLR